MPALGSGSVCPCPRSRPLTAGERLVRAIDEHDIRGVEELLANGGASVHGSVDLETKPIMLAAHRGHVDMIELLHIRGAKLEASAPAGRVGENGEQTMRKGSRPLHFAVSGVQVASLRALLMLGANPNSTDAAGVTPLMTACSSEYLAEGKQRYPLVQALLERGADSTLLADEMGRLSLQILARRGDRYTDVMEVRAAHLAR